MSKKILIIEDEKPLARALELKFTHEGFEATKLSNGEWLEILLQDNSFDTVICDLVMPKVDGFEVLRILQNKSVPVIVLTNLGQAEDEQAARELGCSEFFVKSSTSLSEVVAHVKGMLKPGSVTENPNKSKFEFDGDAELPEEPSNWEEWDKKDDAWGEKNKEAEMPDRSEESDKADSSEPSDQDNNPQT